MKVLFSKKKQGAEQCMYNTHPLTEKEKEMNTLMLARLREDLTAVASGRVNGWLGLGLQGDFLYLLNFLVGTRITDLMN